MMKKVLTLLSLALAFGVVLTGCNSGGDAGAEATTGTAQTEPGQTEAPKEGAAAGMGSADMAPAGTEVEMGQKAGGGN